MISESDLLQHIEDQPQRAAGYKQLVRELSLRGREREELESLLADLVVRGKLVLVARDRYAIAEAAINRNLVVGSLTMHRDGFGFVRPLDRKVRERFEGDIFIPPFDSGEAMHGDQVLVELSPHSRQGRTEGRIVRVMERAHPTVVGTFHYGQRHNYVRPIDDRIKMDVIIAEGDEILPEPSKATSRLQLDRVIGSEASHRPWEDLEGLVVDCEITGWPTATKNPPAAASSRCSATTDDFGVDVEIIIRKHHLPHHFPPSVIDEAAPSPPPLRPPNSSAAAISATYPSSLSMAKPPATSTMPSWCTHFPAETSNFRSTSPTLPTTSAPAWTSTARPRSAAPASISPTAPSPCCPSSSPPISARCARSSDRLVLSCIMHIDARGEIRSYQLCPASSAAPSA